MRTGNIVKLYNDGVVIISEVRKDYVTWISTTHGGCQGGTQMITTEKDVDCDCVTECCGQPDFDCPDCHGTGTVKEIRYGMDKATVLADNMFDYIKSRLLKNFDF